MTPMGQIGKIPFRKSTYNYDWKVWTNLTTADDYALGIAGVGQKTANSSFSSTFTIKNTVAAVASKPVYGNVERIVNIASAVEPRADPLNGASPTGTSGSFISVVALGVAGYMVV